MASEQPPTPAPGQPLVSLPAARTCPFLPPDAYARLRETAPVARVAQPDGREIWAVTRHEDVRAVLADTRFSSDRAHPGFPGLVPVQRQLAKAVRPQMSALDPPEHTAVRRSVLGEFTVKRMNALKPRIQQIVDDHVDAMLDGPKPADLVEDLALPTPSLVICEQLGVPYEDHDFFQGCSRKLFQAGLPPAERQRAGDEFRAYLSELVRRKETAPTEDDLLGRQVLKQRESGDVDHEGIVSVALILLLAGHETTANQISLGTLAVLRHPEVRERLAAGGPGSVRDVVEELLRYFTIADFVTSRVATEDTEVGGMTIRAGEGVVALLNSANHDPAVFSRPDELDPERGGRHHVAFGYGPHQCIGQNLARLELQITFETLFRRVPGLRLAVPYEELGFRDDSAVYGLRELPVTW